MRSIQRKVRTKKRPGVRVVTSSKERDCYICGEKIPVNSRVLQQTIIDTRETNKRDKLDHVYMHVKCAKRKEAEKSLEKPKKRTKKNIFEK